MKKNIRASNRRSVRRINVGGDNLKLVQQKYFTASGEAKVNCYKLTISKKHIQEAGIKESDDLETYVEGNKIIIRKKK